MSDLGRPAVRLSTAELRENLGELATDLIESVVQRDVQSVDFPIDTLDQLVERVDVGTLLAHLTLDLGLGHSGNHSGHRAGQRRYALSSTERSAYRHNLARYATLDLSVSADGLTQLVNNLRVKG